MPPPTQARWRCCMEPLLIILIPGILGGLWSPRPRAPAGSTGRCRARRAARPAAAVPEPDQHRAHPNRWRRRAGHGRDGPGRGDLRSLDSPLGLARLVLGAVVAAALITWRRSGPLTSSSRHAGPLRLLGLDDPTSRSALIPARVPRWQIGRRRRRLTRIPGSLALFDFDGTITWSDTWTPFMKLATRPWRMAAGRVLLAPSSSATVSASCRRAAAGASRRGWPTPAKMPPPFVARARLRDRCSAGQGAAGSARTHRVAPVARRRCGGGVRLARRVPETVVCGARARVHLHHARRARRHADRPVRRRRLFRR